MRSLLVSLPRDLIPDIASKFARCHARLFPERSFHAPYRWFAPHTRHYSQPKHLKLLPVSLFAALLPFTASAATEHVMSVQGTAVNSTSGQLLTAGNVPVRIHDASASGTLMFNDTVSNGIALKGFLKGEVPRK
ncbi:MAG: hypothetical protein HYY37_03375 [Candidatus Aenigmarchaeota archaeon]|nr:hypothetical protein [Candidatus Aenigmarchaeota archaeon]